MAKLTLIHGGKTRRFNLSTGKATFGSGEGAALRLESDEIAELHGEIEWTEGGIVVRSAKGVMPPTVSGVPIKGERILKSGETVKIADAVLSVEYDSGEGPATSKPATGSAGSTAKPAGSPRRSTGGSGGSSRVTPRTSNRGAGRRSAEEPEEGDERAPRSRVQRKSDPTGMLIGIGVAVVLGGLAFKLLTMTSEGLSGESFNYKTAFKRAELRKADSDTAALAQFEALLKEELSASQRAEVQREVASLKESTKQIRLTDYNTTGNKFFDEQLYNFAQKKDVSNSRSYARLFLKRFKWFQSKYPKYTPERLEKLEPYVRKARNAAVMTEPPTRGDLRVEINEIIGEARKVKKMTLAMRAVDDYLNAHGGIDRAKEVAEQFREEIALADKEFVEERMALAADSLDGDSGDSKYLPNYAIRDYLYVIAYSIDESSKDSAFDRLTGIEELTSKHLVQSYKNSKPDLWEGLSEHAGMRAWLEENGVL